MKHHVTTYDELVAGLKRIFRVVESDENELGMGEKDYCDLCDDLFILIENSKPRKAGSK